MATYGLDLSKLQAIQKIAPYLVLFSAKLALNPSLYSCEMAHFQYPSYAIFWKETIEKVLTVPTRTVDDFQNNFRENHDLIKISQQ